MGTTGPAVLTVNAGSSSLQLHLVRDGRVLQLARDTLGALGRTP
ncbi:hypothetical protein [Streptosporangium sp. NPDC000396]